MYNVNINGVITISPKKENMVNVTIAENNFGIKVDSLIQMCKSVVTAPILRIESTSGKVYDYVFCSIEEITNGYSAFFKTDVDTMEIAISTVNKTYACEFVDNATIMAEFTTDPANPSVIDTEIEKSPKSVVVNYEPIQSGSGDPTPDNERPITEYNAVELSGYGKNLFDPANMQKGTIADSDFNLTNVGEVYRTYKMLLPKGTFTISFDKQVNFISGVFDGEYSQLSGSGTSKTFTVNGGWFGISWRDSTSSATNWDDTAPIQLEVGSNVSTYEPYNLATVISEALPETVYGGVWDVEKGVMKVTHKGVDMGDLSWTYNSGELPYFLASLTNYSFPTTSSQIAPPLICEKYATVAQSERVDLTICGNNGATDRIMVNDTNYSDADDFKTAVTGTKIVYELATPYEIQLTPEQVTFLEGTNTLITNGNTIVVEYTKGRVATQADIAKLSEDLNNTTKYLLEKDVSIYDASGLEYGIYEGDQMSAIPFIDKFIEDVSNNKFVILLTSSGLAKLDRVNIQSGNIITLLSLINHEVIETFVFRINSYENPASRMLIYSNTQGTFNNWAQGGTYAVDLTELTIPETYDAEDYATNEQVMVCVDVIGELYYTLDHGDYTNIDLRVVKRDTVSKIYRMTSYTFDSENSTVSVTTENGEDKIVITVANPHDPSTVTLTLATS